MAPAFMASTAVSMLPKAVITITGTCAFCRRISASNCRPSMLGSLRSVSTRSARSTTLRPSSAVAALSTSKPAETSCSSMHAAELVFVFDYQDAFLHAEGRASVSGAVHGQEHAENAAFAGFALHCYLTAVLVHDLGNDGQAQAHALRLGGEERIEDAVELLGVDARAAVDHRDLGGAAGRPRLHRHRSAGRGGLRGVEHQVVEDPLHQLGIEGKRRDLRRVVPVDRDPGRLALHQRRWRGRASAPGRRCPAAARAGGRIAGSG